MDTENNPPVNGKAAPGLPPVTPPSGRFIIQLFLVPGVIVAIAILVLLGFRYLVGGARSPEEFLKQLDSDNVDIRWRGASDLAQVLKRPESTALRSDATFALELAERLRLALTELYQEEEAIRERTRGLSARAQEKAWKKLTPQRDLAQFLAAALGDFVVPVGAPLLCEVALHEHSPDSKGNTLQRRKAVWALGNLGNNCKNFTGLPVEQQAKILEYLKGEANKSPPRGGWAGTALYYLEDKKPAPLGGNLRLIRGLLAANLGPIAALPYFLLNPEVPPGVVEVDRVLARCARDPDRYLRAQVALVINFWDSPLAEPVLLELARDDGHGTLTGIPEAE